MNSRIGLKYKEITIVVILLLCLLGYRGNAQESLNLETLTIDFVPNDFIALSEVRKAVLDKEFKVLSDKVFTTKNASTQDTLRYKELEIALSEINSYKIDSLYRSIDEEKAWSDENKEKWAVSYSMMSFSSIDSTGYFKDINFPKLSFIEDLNGKFIALSATTSYRKPRPKEFEKLYLELSKKFGKPKKRTIRAFGRNKYVFEWRSDSLIYSMISTADENSFSESKENLHLYLIHSEYSNSIRSKIGIGDWIDLK